MTYGNVFNLEGKPLRYFFHKTEKSNSDKNVYVYNSPHAKWVKNSVWQFFVTNISLLGCFTVSLDCVGQKLNSVCNVCSLEWFTTMVYISFEFVGHKLSTYFP